MREQPQRSDKRLGVPVSSPRNSVSVLVNFLWAQGKLCPQWAHRFSGGFRGSFCRSLREQERAHRWSWSAPVTTEGQLGPLTGICSPGRQGLGPLISLCDYSVATSYTSLGLPPLKVRERHKEINGRCHVFLPSQHLIIWSMVILDVLPTYRLASRSLSSWSPCLSCSSSLDLCPRSLLWSLESLLFSEVQRRTSTF